MQRRPRRMRLQRTGKLLVSRNTCSCGRFGVGRRPLVALVCLCGAMAVLPASPAASLSTYTDACGGTVVASSATCSSEVVPAKHMHGEGGARAAVAVHDLGDEGDRLHRLAKAHVVCQHAVDAGAVQRVQEAHAGELVRAQRAPALPQQRLRRQRLRGAPRPGPACVRELATPGVRMCATGTRCRAVPGRLGRTRKSREQKARHRPCARDGSMCHLRDTQACLSSQWGCAVTTGAASIAHVLADGSGCRHHTHRTRPCCLPVLSNGPLACMTVHSVPYNHKSSSSQ